jgi:hypothetical protein
LHAAFFTLVMQWSQSADPVSANTNARLHEQVLDVCAEQAMT